MASSSQRTRRARTVTVDLVWLLDIISKSTAIAFIVLLLVSAALLAGGSEKVANLVAEHAYYSLVVAVSAALASTVLEERKLRPKLRLGLPHPSRELATKPPTVAIVFTSLALLGAVGTAAIAGRPTINLPGPVAVANCHLDLLHFVAVVAYLAYLRSPLPLELLLAFSSTATVFLGVYWAAGILGLALVALRLREKTLNATILSAFPAAATGLLGLAYPAPKLLAWLWADGASIAGLALCFVFSAGLVALLLRGKLRIVEAGVGQPQQPPGRTALVLALAAAVLASIASPLIPHLLNKPGSIIALDTLYNMRHCNEARHKGLLAAGLGWCRPLYIAVVCPIGWLVGPQLYDLIIPSLGLIVFSITIYILTRRLGLGWQEAATAALLTPLLLGPVYTYSGFQTALLAIPAAIAYTVTALGEARGLRRLLLPVAAVLLVYWHPWTALYYTGALALALVILAVQGLLERRGLALRLSLTLLPASIAYTLLVVAASREPVLYLATRLASVRSPLAWALHNYYWGTMMRGELYLAIASTLALVLAEARIEARSLWLYTALVPAVLATVASPAGHLTLRVLATLPLPVYMAARKSLPETTALVAAATSYWLLLETSVSPIA